MAGFRRLQVVAGILRDAGGRVLITERVGDTPFAGLWEFPGGKIQSGETAEQALLRELREELDIRATDPQPLMQLCHDYIDRSVALEFFTINEWRGEPRGCDGQALRWALPETIDPAELLPADAPVLAALLQVP